MSNSYIESLISSIRFKKLVWLIEEFEGFNAKIYKDIAGNLTVGYGHEIIGQVEQDLSLKSLNFSSTQLAQGLSKESAFQLLAYDINARANIQSLFQIDMPDSVWIALTSLCFNIGLANFKQSTIAKLVPSLDLYQIADSMAAWRESSGKFSQGIAKRRLCEILILLQKSLDTTSPLLPSKQFKAPCHLTFIDENWLRLLPSLRNEVVTNYTLYTKNFKDLN